MISDQRSARLKRWGFGKEYQCKVKVHPTQRLLDVVDVMINFSRPSRWQSVEGSCRDVGHTWCSSCVYGWVELGIFVFAEGLKIYFPLRLFSDVARGTLLKNMRNGSILKDVLRSSMFLGASSFFVMFWFCAVRRILGRFYMYSSFYVPGFLSALCSIFIEKKSRRGLLAGYGSVMALEFLNTLFKSHGVVAPVPCGEVLLFSVASSYIFYHFRTHTGRLDIISTLLKLLMSPVMPRTLVRSLRNSFIDNRLTRILLVSVWSFLPGYGVQGVLGLLGQLPKLAKPQETLTRLYRAMASRQNVQFGAFLSCFSAGFLLVNSILWYLPLPRPLRLLLAGFLAGLASVFYRSNSVTLYMAGKALETLFFEGVRRGYCRSWYYGDAILYALSAAVLCHASVFHGYTLRPAFWSFLVSRTRHRVTQVNYDQLDLFGTHASRKPREERIRLYQKAVATGRDGDYEQRTSWEPRGVRELLDKRTKEQEAAGDLLGQQRKERDVT